MVNSSQDKHGYKYTEEFGYIPEDWKIKTVKEVASIQTGTKNTEDKVDNGLYPFFVRSQTVEFINDYAYDEEAVLTAGDGVGVGKVFHYINGKFNVHQRVYKISDFKDIIGKYFYLYFRNNFFNEVKKYTAKSSVDSVRLEMIADMNVLVPPLKEQEKIAEILGDIDNLIDKTQQLINKKKDIKTATMQKLLTPRDDWKEYVIGDLGSTYSGLSGKKKDDFGTGESKYITFLNIMNNVVIDTKQFENVIIQNNENQNRCMKNDLFFNTSSETPEEVGMCATLQDDISNLYLNSFCFGYRLKQPNIVNPRFFAYIFRTHYGRTIMQTLAQGSTRYNLAKDKFMEYKILLPEYLEQNKTTLVLSDMDGEIEALEKELNKYKDLKIGMMQQLLTGKVRLV